MNKKIVYGLLTIGLVISICFLVRRKITHEEFDSDKWKNSTETEMKMSLRWEMMNSFRNN